MPLRNVISFSVWGDSPKYLVGMIRNLELCARFYPGWDVQIYCDRNVRDWIRENIQSADLGNLTWSMKWLADDHWCPRMMQRFLIADDPTVGRFICRDADSRIMQREVDAVNEWIVEDKVGHVMRDHPAHAQPMLGGLWGAQWRRDNWQAPNMEAMIRDYLSAPEGSERRPYRRGQYADDQNFLHLWVWPWLSYSCTQHDSVCRQAYSGAKPFPTPRNTFPRFCGEVWEVNPDGSEFPRDDDWRQIKEEE